MNSRRLGALTLVLSTLACSGLPSPPIEDPKPQPSPSPPPPEPPVAPSSAELPRLSVGYMHWCALDGQGRAKCQGDDALDQLRAPDEELITVSAGLYHSCGLRPDHSVICWGSDRGPYTRAVPKLPPPPEGLTLASVAAGDAFTCGLTLESAVVCWGNKGIQPPIGRFVEVVAGYDHACVRSSDKSVRCFGVEQAADETYGSDGEPGADTLECATMEGVPEGICKTAERISRHWTPPPAGLTADQLAAGASHSCVLRSGKVSCFGADGWGDGNTIWAGQTRAPPDLADVVEVTAGGGHSCARRSGGDVTCWGDKSSPEGLFTDISSGASDACGVRPDRTIFCW